MSTRTYNFSPGPSMLPQAVIEKVRQDLLDWQGLGMSVMEISHRSDEFLKLTHEAEQNLRQLMGIPKNYKIIWSHGGASLQFSAVALNLTQKKQADYIITGQWGQKALKEAQKFTNAQAIIDTSNELRTPSQQELKLNDAADYVHYTPNETIVGVEFGYIPDTAEIPLVADLSSSILSQPMDVSKFSVIYAGAQKNISISGLAVSIIEESLIGKQRADTPALLDWQNAIDNGSMFNTPNTFAWFIASEVFKWLLEQGGLESVQRVNQRKASLLYETIDASSFYDNPVDKQSRSLVNIPFTLADESLNHDFLKQAQAQGLTNLKGHRAIGGMRASIYNSMPVDGVEALVHFMHEFERNA